MTAVGIGPEKARLEAPREALGRALVQLGAERPDMVVLSPDVSLSTRAIEFRRSFPERFICAGIAEQNTMSVAAGLASWGYIPVVALYAVFAAGKAADQVLNGIAYPNLNVKIVATHGGINVGADGPTHQAIADLGTIRSFPNLAVITAADASEVEPALRAALEHPGPVYLRLERAATAVLGLGDHPYRIGQGLTVREGTDVTIIGIGSLVWEGLKAAEQLALQGLSARVIDMRSLKPLDRDLVLAAAGDTAGIVTAEDHSMLGGLYSAVAEVVGLSGGAPLRAVALPDCFAESGSADALRHKHGLDSARIVEAALELCHAGRKGACR